MRASTRAVAVLATVAALAGAARAQDALPGGWSPRVGYQSFGSVAVAGANPYAGFGSPQYGTGVSYSPYGAFTPSFTPAATVPFYAPPPRMANTLVPLGDTFRRTTRSRRGR